MKAMNNAILALALLTTSAPLWAQAPVRDPDTGKYTYKAVTEVSNANDSILFERGCRWYEGEFQTTQLNLRNLNDGMISHAGSFPVTFTISGLTVEFQVAYNALVEARNGRYRYTITDFSLSQSAAGTTESVSLEGYIDRKFPFAKKTQRRVHGEVFAQVDIEVKKMVVRLTRVMSGGAFSTDDW